MMTEVELPMWESAVRLLMAGLCGGIIGWERESRGRAAGLRTHMLVALGSTGFTIVSIAVMQSPAMQNGGSNVDVTRIIAGIVGGIGFLGAGAIIQSGGRVQGLTTAAGMWVVAAIGVAVGTGLYDVGLMITVFTFLILAVLRRLESPGKQGQESRQDAGGPGLPPSR